LREVRQRKPLHNPFFFARSRWASASMSANNRSNESSYSVNCPDENCAVPASIFSRSRSCSSSKPNAGEERHQSIRSPSWFIEHQAASRLTRDSRRMVPCEQFPHGRNQLVGNLHECLIGCLKRGLIFSHRFRFGLRGHSEARFSSAAGRLRRCCVRYDRGGVRAGGAACPN
jgi:hypothetical protein